METYVNESSQTELTLELNNNEPTVFENLREVPNGLLTNERENDFLVSQNVKPEKSFRNMATQTTLQGIKRCLQYMDSTEPKKFKLMDQVVPKQEQDVELKEIKIQPLMLMGAIRRLGLSRKKIQ